MKLTEDHAKALVILAAAAGAVYVIWQVKGAFSNAADAISSAVDNAYNTVSDTIDSTKKVVDEAISNPQQAFATEVEYLPFTPMWWWDKAANTDFAKETFSTTPVKSTATAPMPTSTKVGGVSLPFLL